MRKTKTVIVGQDGGRDAGRAYYLTEMSARQAEAWAYRVLCAIASNYELPDNYKDLGMAGVAALGFNALLKIDWHLAEPLLQEMIDCVQFVPDPAKPEVMRQLIDDDTEEVLTLMLLRKEVFELHTGFLQGENLLSSMLSNRTSQGA